MNTVFFDGNNIAKLIVDNALCKEIVEIVTTDCQLLNRS